MFLRHVKGSIYHPLDPASMHPIYDYRVLKFGMNHSKDLWGDEFEERSVSLKKWADIVRLLLKVRK